MTTRPMPTLAWLEGAITGRQPIPGSERDTLSSALFRLYADAADAERSALSSAIIDWISAVHANRDAWQRRLGVAGLSSDLVQVWTAARLLDLEPVAAFVAEHLLRERALGWDLAVGSRRGTSHDPEAAVYHLLAASAGQARRFRHIWLRICARAGVEWPEHFIDIGLLGLRHCPSAAGAAEPPTWLAGFAAWLPHATSRRAFDLRWRSYRASTPRGPGIWDDWLAPLDGRLEELGCQDDRRRWLLVPRTSVGPGPREMTPLHSPYPQDLAAALVRLTANSSPDDVHQRLEALFRRHEHYVWRTGDTYFHVRASAEAARKLLEVPARWAAIEALQRVQRGLESEPGNDFLWNLLGRALAAVGRSSAAIWTLSDAVRRFPADPPSHVELARLFWAHGELDEAESVLRGAVLRFPSDEHAHVELARLLWARGELDEAESVLRGAVPRFPSDAPSHTELARLLWARGNHREATQILDAAPRDQGVAGLRARLYQGQGLPADAPSAPSLPEGTAGSIGEASDGAPAWLDTAAAEAKRADLALSGAMRERTAEAGRQRLATALQVAPGHPTVLFYARRHGIAVTVAATENPSALLELASRSPEDRQSLRRAADGIGGRMGRLLGKIAVGEIGVAELQSLAGQLQDKRQQQALAPVDRAAAHWAERWLRETDPVAAAQSTTSELLRELAEIMLPGSDPALAAADAA